MTVARILNQKGWKVFTVEANAPLQTVIDVLSGHDVGVVVVTAADGSPAGIVSERDVIRALSGSAAVGFARTASDVMSRSLETCSPDDAESEIMERMNAKGIRHLPVMAGGRLTGLVSIRDVVRLRIEKIDELMRAIRHEADLIK